MCVYKILYIIYMYETLAHTQAKTIVTLLSAHSQSPEVGLFPLHEAKAQEELAQAFAGEKEKAQTIKQ